MLTSNDLKNILEIAISLSYEKNYTKLLERILDESMKISKADGGTLYVYQDNELHFYLMRNNTLNTYLGGKGEGVDLPPVEMNLLNVSSYCALKKEIVRIDDVYDNKKFDFEGPMKYDKITGYHTQSLLAIPLIDKDDNLLGVVQLINSISDGKVVPFDDTLIDIVSSLASESAIILSNMLLYDNIKKLLLSFVNAMTTAIDSRTPYNAYHTKGVTKICREFINFLNAKGFMKISDADKDEILMAAGLHDVGKMIVPLEVLNKESRLGGRLEIIEMRYQLINEYIKNDYLANILTEEQYQKEKERLAYYYAGILKINNAGFLTDELACLAKEIIKYEYNHLGKACKLIIDEESKLTIVKGTLSKEERAIIESHAVYTEKILSEIDFGAKYKNVPYIASSHHEYLDGSGYPKHLKGDEITPYVRMLTIVDIYESLTSDDRPYKKSYDSAGALKILHFMVDEGKLDKQILEYFEIFIAERSKEDEKETNIIS